MKLTKLFRQQTLTITEKEGPNCLREGIVYVQWRLMTVALSHAKFPVAQQQKLERVRDIHVICHISSRRPRLRQ